MIMAGGRGTRFWPLSRAAKPKQLLKIVGTRTMIQATVDRLAPVASPDHILIITGAAHFDEIKSQLPEIPEENIIAEPVGRNTSPCIALAAKIIKERDPGATMCVFPADHIITKADKFINAVKSVVNELETIPGALATMGIRAVYPETGYGYIRRGEKIAPSIYKVDEFLEKPDTATAKKYSDSGDYYWNSGMFFWKVESILNELDACLPELMKAMEDIECGSGPPGLKTSLETVYPRLPSISIDYGVMEKAGASGKALVIEADPGWSDVGSWRSLYELTEADAKGNRSRGGLITIDSSGVLAHNDKRLVAIVGVDDIIVVETDDAILILNKDRAQDVRQITDRLRELGKEIYL